MLYLSNEKHKDMITTTSLAHYKRLKAKGINATLTTKQELNK